MKMELSFFSAALVRPLLDSAAAEVFYGLPEDESTFIQELVKQLRNPNAQINAEDALQLIQWLVRKTNNDAYCLQTTHQFSVQSSCQLQHLFLCCNTLREGLYYLEKYAALLSDELNIHVTRTRDNIIKVKFPVLEHAYLASQRQRTEIYLGLILNWLRQLCGKELEILTICLPFPPPQHAGEYTKQWSAPVEFSSTECSIQFHNQWLDHGLHKTNPHIFKIMQAEVEELYRKQARSGSLAEKIYSVMKVRKIRLNANQDEVASYFHMSARTLNRRLSQEDTSLKQLVTKIRVELAAELLEHSQHSIDEISRQIDLSGRRTLDRIFIKEMGVTPAQFRQNLELQQLEEAGQQIA